MDIVEQKQVTKQVVIGRRCDVCGKETTGLSDPNFYHFNSHHNDWGSDSEESYEWHDVCSSDCYFGKLKDLISDNSDSTTFEADEKSIDFIKQMIK